MACNSRSSCGPDFEQLRLWLKGVILELLNDGTLQAGLKDCEGEWLGKGRGVVLCDALADLLCDLIDAGKLCVPKIAGFTSDCTAKTLTITMADGTELTADTSCFGGSGADGNTKIKDFTYDPASGIAKITDTENREFLVTISTKNTTNRAMAWEPVAQEVSITDTDDNTVKTPVVFNTITPPPININPAPNQFIGKSATVFLGEPATWLRMLLPDGRIGKMPVFLDDTVVPTCEPITDSDDTGRKRPLVVKVLGVLKGNTRFDEFFSAPLPQHDISVSFRTSPSTIGDNIATWKALIQKVKAAYNIDDGDLFLYDVKTSIGWVNLAELNSFDGSNAVKFEWRIYGKSRHTSDELDPIFRQTSYGISNGGYVSKVTPNCGFVNATVSNFYNTVYAETTEQGGTVRYSAHSSTYPFGIRYAKIGDGEIVTSDIFYDINRNVLNGKPPELKFLYVVTPFGVFDFKDAFGDARKIITDIKKPDYSETNLKQEVMFYRQDDLLIGLPDALALGKSNNETGWQLYKGTYEISNPDLGIEPNKPTKTVHFVGIRLDPSLIPNASNSDNQKFLIG